MRKFTPSEYCYVLSMATLNASKYYRHPWSVNIKNFQEQKIKKILDFAYKHSNFYKSEYDKRGVNPSNFNKLEDLTLFPSFNKDDLLLNPESVETFKVLDTKKMIRSVSSGSSGKVITIFHDPKDTWNYALGRFRLFNILGNYKPWDTALYIYTSPYPAGSFLGLYPTAFISTLNNIKNTSERIKQIRPKFISSYPSHMMELMKEFTKTQAHNLQLKLISLGSELSTRTERDWLSKHFNCPVLDEYSSEELGWIAYECPQYQYHLWEDIAYIEDTQKDGEVIGTNLHNTAMPFIRYRQGDLITIAGHMKCKCGRTGRILERFLGRKNDTFVFKDQTLHPAFLLDSVYSILLAKKDVIADFCLIQESSTLVTMQIVPGKSYKEDERIHITQKLKQLIPAQIIVQIVKSSELLKTTSGKRNPIISKVNGNN